MRDPKMHGQTSLYLPASTVEEATSRIFSLTGARNSGTRGEKRALIALRDALALDIEVTRTNAVTARAIAEALGVEWLATYEDRNKVGLDGLNALLAGVSSAYHHGSLRRLSGNRPSGLEGPAWDLFNPAQSKIEAVNRISALTGSGPEWLGPGSKEHKRVLVNLASRLLPHLDTGLSKTKLGAAIATELGAPWSDECESTGETISLVGLNTLLAGAERHLGRLGIARALLFGTPEAEGTALAAALLDAWRGSKDSSGTKSVVWDARRCISWMEGQSLSRGPNENEWQGFYFEAKGRERLNAAFAPNPNPPRSKYGNTIFDYSLGFVWDLKAHTEYWYSPAEGVARRGRDIAPLNDQEAIDQCVEEQGLGFLIAGGIAVADDDGQFVTWHRARKMVKGVKSRSSNSGISRRRKAAFQPLHVEAYFFHNTEALNAARASGQVLGFSQGKQAPDHEGEEGRARRPKYNLSVSKCRGSGVQVAGFNW